MRLFLACLSILTVLTTGSEAADRWQTTQLDPADFPAEIVPENRKATSDGMPDGLVTTREGGDIVSAWYVLPTRRYKHGILGDDIEAGGLIAVAASGQRHNIQLPRSEVFEDIAPRLTDLDGDGTTEIITIRSSVTRGASVAVYGIMAGSLVEKASTRFIGRKNRWLNIAGIAPFLGTRGNEILFVETPHIGGTLFLFRHQNGRLFELAGLRDFSNHVVGSQELRLSALADVDGNGRTDLAVPSADRRTLRIVGVTREGLREIANARLPAAIDKAIDVQASGTQGFVVGLEDGSVYLVHP
jgi:hypothetical protein